MPVTEPTYHALALEDGDGQWELCGGRLRRKPDMSAAHNEIMTQLGFQIMNQLDRDEFRVRINASRVRFHDHTTYFVPDVMVVPASAFRSQLDALGELEFYDLPLPFVAEVWSPSTGDYDVDRKIPEYQRRGDAEIWRLHPYDRSVTIYRRQDDGTYARAVVTSGMIQLHALPTVEVDIDEIFAFSMPGPETT